MNKRYRQLLAATLTTLAACTAHAGDHAPCGPQANARMLCGGAPAEDMELTPDGRHVLLSTMHGLSGRYPSRLRIMPVAGGAIADLPVTRARETGWGDAACPEPSSIGAHGMHLATLPDGRHRLLAVNHEGRESIEWLELLKTDKRWHAVWRGCVENIPGGMLNDVVGLKDGSLVASVMFEFAANAADPTLRTVVDGRNTGYLVRWRPGAAMERVPNSDMPFPNGLQPTADQQGVWVAAWTAREVRRFDLRDGTMTTLARLDFMPDNLTLTRQGALVAAGISDPEVFRLCFIEKNEDCQTDTRIAAIDPATGRVTDLFSAPPGVLAGASVGLQAGPQLFVGSFAGDRLLIVHPARRAAR